MIVDQFKKFNVAKYISIVSIVVVLIVVFFIMYIYQIKGEAVPPFKITKMVAVSTVRTQNLQLIDNVYNADLVQNNDIKIAIEKNPEYKKEAIIRKITINNIQIDKKETQGTIEIYRPVDGVYKYEEPYKIGDKIEYEGAQETFVSEENVQISNQGGIIDLGVIVKDLGKIQYNDNEAIKVDGTLLKRAGIENISFELKFDLIIELESNIKLKTKVKLDLPAGNIVEDGIGTIEQTNLNMVFKRI